MECDMWNLTEVVGVVTTDTAENMLKMMEYLPIHFQHGGCLNHILQLVIKDELFEKPSIESKPVVRYAVLLINQCPFTRAWYESKWRMKQKSPSAYFCIKMFQLDGIQPS